jgi:phage nucleotide-binding protein
MAINLSALSKPSNDRPIIATLFGEGGMGKTTLAAMFPDPVFIRTEDGTASLAGADNVALFDVAQSPQDVFEQIEALATQDHAFKTVVIDSVTQFEKLCVRKILDDEPNVKCKNMAAAHGGYGKAFGILDGMHQDLREAAGYLASAKGMNVVFLAHATTEELELPDIDKYSRYTVTLHKNRQYDCSHHYTNNVDLVAFIRLKTNVRGTTEGKKRAISDGEREIICFPVASNVSKNRFGITEPIPFNFETGNPFAPYLKGN